MTFIVMLEKAAAAGALTSLVAKFCYPAIINLRVLGTIYPSWAVFAGLGVVASGVADFIHPTVLAEIGLHNKALDEVSMVTGVAVATGTFYGAMYFVSPQLASEFGFGCAVGTAAISEFGSSFLVNLLNGT